MEHLKELLKIWLKKEELGWLEDEVNLIFALLGIFGIVASALFKLGKWTLDKYHERVLIRDLEPYYTAEEIKKATGLFIKTRCQNVSPSETDEPSQNYALVTTEKLIPFFIKKAFKGDSDKYKFYFVLAGSGMGKTTFLLNLYLRYKYQNFWNILSRKHKIKIFPLGNPNSLEDIKKIKDEEKKDTILLLDAFDEDAKAVADYKERIKEILDVVWRFREVVITCRTQFFPNEVEVPKRTGLLKFGGSKGQHEFAKIYISPFSIKDINSYLYKKYLFSGLNISFYKIQRAKSVIIKSPNLMARPMLLSHIDEIINQPDYSYELSYQIYKTLIKGWIDREGGRQLKKVEEFKHELFRFSKELSKEIYDHRDQKGGLWIGEDDIKKYAEEFQINLSTIDMKSRSLLNRNGIGNYKFSHKSILEYFLAIKLCESPDFFDNFNFDGMDMTKKFFFEYSYNEALPNFFINQIKDWSNKSYFIYNISPLKHEKVKINSIHNRHMKNLHQVKYVYLAPEDRKGEYFGAIMNLFTAEYHVLNNIKEITTDEDELRWIEEMSKRRERVWDLTKNYKYKYKLKITFPIILGSKFEIEV